MLNMLGYTQKEMGNPDSTEEGRMNVQCVERQQQKRAQVSIKRVQLLKQKYVSNKSVLKQQLSHIHASNGVIYSIHQHLPVGKRNTSGWDRI